jgi:hypothetical protein
MFEACLGEFVLAYEGYLGGLGTWFDAYLGTCLMHILAHGLMHIMVILSI